MNKEVKRIYDLLISSLSVADLQLIYDEEMEFLHSALLGLDDTQKKYYQDLKDNLSVHSILEHRIEQMVFNKTYNP